MYTLYTILDLIFRGIQLVLFIRILISWIPHDPYHPFIELLNKITDPILTPCRDLMDRFIPASSVGIDFSPILAFMLLDLVRTLVLRLMGMMFI